MQPQALQATIDETGTVRQPFYKRLMAMAQAGQVADARTILDEMQSEGLAPGARAYHGLIYAHVRAGDANGALLAIKEEYAAGRLLMILDAGVALLSVNVSLGVLTTYITPQAFNRCRRATQF